MATTDSRPTDDQEFEVEAIVGHRVHNGKTYYQVRWKGYSPEDDTFETLENLTNCAEALAAYNRSIGRVNPAAPAIPPESPVKGDVVHKILLSELISITFIRSSALPAAGSAPPPRDHELAPRAEISAPETALAASSEGRGSAQDATPDPMAIPAAEHARIRDTVFEFGEMGSARGSEGADASPPPEPMESDVEIIGDWPVITDWTPS
jgi:hypothetical protein